MEIKEQYLELEQGQIFIKQWKFDRIDACQKSPIILFHESLGCVALWRDFPEKLALRTGRDVIAYDRLGFGQSSIQLKPLELDFVTEEGKKILPQILSHLALNDFVVMGHSVGGGMATICAALYPEHCKAVITESAQSVVEKITLEGIQKAKISFNDEKLFNRLAKYHADKTQWVLDAWTETWLSPQFVTWNLDYFLSKVQCPLLAIHGELDEYASIAQPKRFVELTQGINELCMIEDCGHFPHQQKPSEVLASIEKFLKNIE
ncbi:alpha/beta fold hydrolase [Acinetobacter sp. ANC 4973]|uniref:alpha/beta fold hydrolase n=1 Tax=Acinetobacter sp. ANC 4973 TaxID=1977871 RepID=UPI000A34D146|nr:alpha/beta hydrolase [Acinetobacter sp. ANC 4973]OTG99711.1 alpha/beta hydrolase [Acinetobacter sp. ANC 4973]